MSNPITIQLDTTDFAPGSTITGKILWSTGPTNNTLELRLFWFTEGRGTQDIEIADTLSYDTRSRLQGDEDFSLHLPAAPLSFSGKLVSLQWAIEAVAIQQGVSERADITVSLTGKEVSLTPVANPVTGKKKKFGKQ